MARDFLAKGGKTGELIASKDWSKHPLGPIESWPQSLKSVISICLHSRSPMAVYWGENFYLFYNDAWSPILSETDKPEIGTPAKDVPSLDWKTLSQ